VLTGEESNDNTMTNTLMVSRFRDTTNWTVPVFNGETVNQSIKRNHNMNWVVEVDPVTARATKKHYNMGRASHELGYAMPDGRTVYVTDDDTPAAFYKFVSDTAGNYNKGQLYFYRQSSNGEFGSWIPVPMNLDTMINVTEVVKRRGATMFTRHEWVAEIDGKIYITETGNDNSGTLHRDALRISSPQGGRLAKHLESRVQSDSSLIDYYGRVLRLDTTTWKMDVFLEGGAGAGGLNFANPDCLTSVKIGNKTYMVICEDINGTSQGRVSSAANSAGRSISELYWLDMSIPNPTRADLKRMLVGVTGAEITGARFTPDGKTMFVNVQHPTTTNPAPYNRSYTLAMWGYETPTGLIIDPPHFKKSDRLQVEVNAASRMAYFDRETDVSLHDSAGKRLERHRKVQSVDIAHLTAGTYFMRFAGGASHKLVLQ
jgi:secreted PhoX family phosphatase